VGHDQVEALVGERQGPGVVHLELDVETLLVGLPPRHQDHLRREVDADHLGVGERMLHLPGGEAGAAAQVQHPLGLPLQGVESRVQRLPVSLDVGEVLVERRCQPEHAGEDLTGPPQLVGEPGEGPHARADIRDAVGQQRPQRRAEPEVAGMLLVHRPHGSGCRTAKQQRCR
jgi:hypothetical protein